MKNITLAYILLLSVVNSATAQSSTWTFDKTHSKIQFDIDHMVISEVTGQFHDYEGTIISAKEDFSDAQVEFTIKVNSIDTDSENRDNDLRSANFFDVEQYPTITFKSTSMEKAGDGKYKLTGNLTIHGITKTVVLNIKYGGTVNDPWGNTKAGFKITGSINRKDFGLTYNAMIESGGLVVGEEVRIICKVELKKQK